MQVYETPVGFKYVGPLLREDKIALGGEESAGMTIRGHLPEKDGILACLLVAEMIAARQASLADQLRDLFRRVGREFWPVRMNLHLSEDAQAKLPARLSADFKEFAGRRVARTDRIDGLKLIFDDGSWVLMRPFGHRAGRADLHRGSHAGRIAKTRGRGARMDHAMSGTNR